MQTLIIQFHDKVRALPTEYLWILLGLVTLLKLLILLRQARVTKGCKEESKASYSRILSIVAFFFVAVYSWEEPPHLVFFALGAICLLGALIFALLAKDVRVLLLDVLLVVLGLISGIMVYGFCAMVYSAGLLVMLVCFGAIGLDSLLIMKAEKVRESALDYDEKRAVKQLPGIWKEFFMLQHERKTASDLTLHDQLVVAACAGTDTSWLFLMYDPLIFNRCFVNSGILLWCLAQPGHSVRSPILDRIEILKEQQDIHSLLSLVDLYTAEENKINQPYRWILANSVYLGRDWNYSAQFIQAINEHVEIYDRMFTLLSDLRAFFLVAMDLRYRTDLSSKCAYYKSLSKETRFVFLYVMSLLHKNECDYHSASAITETMITLNEELCGPSKEAAETCFQAVNQFLQDASEIKNNTLLYRLSPWDQWDQYRTAFLEAKEIFKRSKLNG